jgi:hypothetical protein
MDITNKPIIDRTAFRFGGQEFLQLTFDSQRKDCVRYFCVNDSIPENLALAQGYGYKSISSFFKAYTAWKMRRSENKERYSVSTF